MKLIFAEEAWEGYLYWQKQDRKMVEPINKLTKEIQRDPLKGSGNPSRSSMRWQDFGLAGSRMNIA